MLLAPHILFHDYNFHLPFKNVLTFLFSHSLHQDLCLTGFTLPFVSNFEWLYSNFFLCSLCRIRRFRTGYLLVRTQPPYKTFPQLLLLSFLLMCVRHSPRVSLGGGVHIPSSNPLLNPCSQKHYSPEVQYVQSVT